MRILRVFRRTKNFGVRHDLVRGAREAGRVRVVYARTENQQLADSFTKPLDIQKYHMHAKTVLNVI